MSDEHGGLVVCRPPPITVRGDTQGLTLLSDLHLGAANVDYGLIHRELLAAAEHEDRVLINGDVFDAILPRDAKRYSPVALHPRILGSEDLINRLVDWAFELLSPYADRIDLVGVGNHDTAVSKHHSTDPVLLLVRRLNDFLITRGLSHRVWYGGYCGFMDYRFHFTGQKREPILRRPSPPTDEQVGRKVSGNRPKKDQRRFVLYYHHGFGKSGSLSGAAGDYQRTTHVEGADAVWLAHQHTRVVSHVRRVHCPARGIHPGLRDVYFLRTGAYFDTYLGQSQGDIAKSGRKYSYAADQGYQPLGNGGLRVVISKNSVKVIQ